MSLLMLRDQGRISRLQFQPQFKLHVKEQELGTYKADAHYYDDAGNYIVEDSKCGDFIDDFAKWKIRHFQIEYGITVSIPQRKAGKI